MLLKLSRFFLFASVFCVVVVLSGTFFPFIGGKYYFFRIAVEAALAFFLLWWGFEAPNGEVERRFKSLLSNPLFRAVSVFVLVYTLATLFADDPHIAFWSNFERGDGGFQMLHYYTFFVLLGALFTTRRDWIKMFKVSVIAAVGMILYGLGAAAFLPNFVGPYRDAAGNPSAPTFFARIFSSGNRFQGSLGNPAYVAPYLLFSMFYVLYIWFSEPKAQRTVNRQLMYGALAIVFLVFFVLSGTRGGFLGLAAAAIVFFIYLAFSDKRLRKPAGIGFGALIAIAILAFVFRGPIVAHNLPGSRFLTINFKEQTAQTRFWTWGSAWEGFKDRPILGWGPENFSTVFDKYFNTKHYIPGQNTETWFDRAHSIIFDTLAETGVLGLLSYLGMLAVFYWQFFKNRMKLGSGVLQGLLFVILIGYFVQALILFDVLAIYLNLFLVLAFGMFAFQQNRNELEQ